MLNERDFIQVNPNKNKKINELNELGNDLKEQNNHKNFKNKFLSQTLYKLNSEENNSYLDYMLSELAFYKYKKNEKLSKLSRNMNTISTSQNLIYNFLEKHLFELSYITNKERREERIMQIYQWYKEKKKFEKDIKTISYKSYKEKNEIDRDEYLLNKNAKKSKNLEVEKNHRNLELINKNMLNEYERKKAGKPFLSLKKYIPSKTLSSQGRNTILTSTNNSESNFEIFDLNNKYSSLRGTNFLTKKKYYKRNNTSYIDKPEGGLLEKDYLKYNQENLTENIVFHPDNKEYKFSYSYLRPIDDLNTINLEKKIIKEKNKLLSFKRNQEEIKEKMKEFGSIRAKYKENLNNKYEMKRLLNLYVNQNNFSSYLLKKYKKTGREQRDTFENEEIKSINESKEQEINDINKVRKSMNINSMKSFKSNKFWNNKFYEEENNYSYINFNSENIQNIDLKRDRSKSYLKLSLTPKVKLMNESNDEKNKEKSESSGKPNRNTRISLTKRFSVRKKRKTFSQRKSSMIINLLSLKLFSDKNEKIKTNKIQNLEEDSKHIKTSNDINIKEYKMKYPKEKVSSDLINKNIKEKKLDNLPKILINDVLNKEKFNYQQICKITKKPTNYSYINSDINQRTKLNLLNKDNFDKINKRILIKIKKKKHFEKLNKRYNTYKHNLLSMRQSISKDKRIEYQNLVDKIKLKKLNDSEFYDENLNEFTEIDANEKNNQVFGFKRKTEQKNFSLLKALVNPNDDSSYSRLFLPRNGSMLLKKKF